VDAVTDMSIWPAPSSTLEIEQSMVPIESETLMVFAVRTIVWVMPPDEVVHVPTYAGVADWLPPAHPRAKTRISEAIARKGRSFLHMLFSLEFSVRTS
jgi:hypothetical protein